MMVRDLVNPDVVRQAHTEAGVNLDFLENKKDLVRVSPWPCGREGYLPKGLFDFTVYDFFEGYRPAVEQIQKTWKKDQHVNAVLNSKLAGRGTRLVDCVMTEMVILSMIGHQAEIGVTTAKIDPEVDGNVVFSLWDNGQEYGGHDDIMDRFITDSFGSLLDDKKNEKSDSGAEAYPTLVVSETVLSMGGKLSILSGSKRVDITEGDSKELYFEPKSTEPIVGNLLVATLPIRPRIK